MLVRDLNLQAARQDERRIEVIANGLPLWGGSQLAVDTTLVSPLTSAGAPPPQWGYRRRSPGRSPPRQGTHLPGVRAGVAVPLGRPRHRGGRTLECGSGQLRPVVGSSTGTHCPPSATCNNNRCHLLGDGRDCCRLPQPGPLLPACFPCRSPIPPMLTASHLCSATSSLTQPSHLPLPPAWRSPCVSSAPPEPLLHWDRVDLS